MVNILSLVSAQDDSKNKNVFIPISEKIDNEKLKFKQRVFKQWINDEWILPILSRKKYVLSRNFKPNFEITPDFLKKKLMINYFDGINEQLFNSLSHKLENLKYMNKKKENDLLFNKKRTKLEHSKEFIIKKNKEFWFFIDF